MVLQIEELQVDLNLWVEVQLYSSFKIITIVEVVLKLLQKYFQSIPGSVYQQVDSQILQVILFLKTMQHGWTDFESL